MINCLHCKKEIKTKQEHSEMCPVNFVNGIQLSHGLSFKDHMTLMLAEQKPEN